MSKRLQVLLSEQDYKKYQEIASAMKMSLGAWVRSTLDSSANLVALGKKKDKLKALERAYYLSFPVSDIDTLNSEILRGQLGESKV